LPGFQELMMIIREEKADDFAVVYDFVKTAFETARVRDGHEQDLVSQLRSSDRYIRELALVAEAEGRMIGYLMLTKTFITNADGEHEALVLAPVAVAEEHRNAGIGSELIRTGMEKAKAMGFGAVFLAGDTAYYSRFGFVPAIRHGIKCNLEVPTELVENIMVCELRPQALDGITGVFEFVIPI
jgi:putative acetyltransferase